jgi:hypothetical protein
MNNTMTEEKAKRIQSNLIHKGHSKVVVMRLKPGVYHVVLQPEYPRHHNSPLKKSNP